MFFDSEARQVVKQEKGSCCHPASQPESPVPVGHEVQRKLSQSFFISFSSNVKYNIGDIKFHFTSKVYICRHGRLQM